MNEETKQCLEWLASGDTGISSETMMSAITGIPVRRNDHPSDMADVGRCVRMLRRLPFLRDKLELVIQKHPHWMPFIDCWKHLERLYDDCIKFESLPESEQKRQKRKKHFATPHKRGWELMQELTVASRYLRGMRMQNGPNHWKNSPPETF